MKVYMNGKRYAKVPAPLRHEAGVKLHRQITATGAQVNKVELLNDEEGTVSVDIKLPHGMTPGERSHLLQDVMPPSQSSRRRVMRKRC